MYELSANLQVTKEERVYNSQIRHVYTLTGSLCLTDALWLKETLKSYTYPAHIVVDISQVHKTDLIAVNALAVAHKKHHLQVVMPQREEACEIFHLTRFYSTFAQTTTSTFHGSQIFNTTVTV